MLQLYASTMNYICTCLFMLNIWMLFPVQESSFQVYKPIQFPDSSGHLRFCTLGQSAPHELRYHQTRITIDTLVFVNVQ